MSNTTVFRLVTSSGEEKTTKVQVNICRKKSPTPISPVPGTPDYYRNRYLDFLERHGSCGHIPPDYYMGPMFILDTEEHKNYYEKYILTSKLKKYGVSHKELPPITKKGKEVKPFLADSYGFKYCIYFTLLERTPIRKEVKDWIKKVRLNLQEFMEQGLIKKDYKAKYDSSKLAEFRHIQKKYNDNFKSSDNDQIESTDAEKAKMEEFYTNIELDNERFREFAFATHPQAYMPDKMSEFSFRELAQIGLTPDFKEWEDPATWRQAFITGENMDLQKLFNYNKKYYGGAILIPSNKLAKDISITMKEMEEKNKIEEQEYNREKVRKNSLPYEKYKK